MARKMNVVCYDPEWATMFEIEKERLLGVFDELLIDIHHFGSTTIEKMPAKPTIDIMVVVNDIEKIDQFNDAMFDLGYLSRGENGIEGRRYFVKLHEDGENHSVHVHIYGDENPHVADELMFRDFLRIDKDSFDAYSNVKRKASEQFLHSPGQYVDAKHDCVMKIMDKARCYYSRNVPKC